MPQLTETDAIAAARRSLALQDTDAGTAWRVRRLDGGSTYFLVFLQGQIASVDAGDGMLLASAQTARAPVAITEAQALALSGLGAAAHAQLVWKPCAASRSMFDPLWEVVLDTQHRYLDQRGTIWPALPDITPGA